MYSFVLENDPSFGARERAIATRDSTDLEQEWSSNGLSHTGTS